MLAMTVEVVMVTERDLSVVGVAREGLFLNAQ